MKTYQAQSVRAVEYTDFISIKVYLTNECLGYDIKQFDSEELWGMQSTPSYPQLPGLLRPGVVASDRVLSMGKVELNCVLMLNQILRNRIVLTFKLCTYTKLNCLK